MSELTSVLIGFFFNLIVAIILVRFIYFPSTHSKRYVLTFLAFNTVIYFVLHFLISIEIGIGVGFGLFAIFTILRYRTDPLPVREMTYLFIIAALPVMNATNTGNANWSTLIAANLIILLLMFVLEKGWGFKFESSKRVIYEKIELIHPERRAELIADLENRLGIKIKRVAVGKVNFLKDTAELTVFYDEVRQNNFAEDDQPVLVAYSNSDFDE
ncbi:MAG TPA: DUF4956 domain-containing protein [Anaerolineaceae bacterium]|nr:DUF4956 domain-containing protein [Anaerolineaceae bacterium]